MTEGHVEPHERARVGAMLRKCRIRAGLDLAEVAQCLHIRQPFLQAIETGQFEALPAPVYAMGFVRAYAEHLGLDANEVVRRFRNEIVGLGAQAPLHFPLPVMEGSTPKGGVLLLGALIAIAAYAGWYVTSTHGPEVAEIVAPVPERLAPAAGGERRQIAPSGDRAHVELRAPSRDTLPASPPANVQINPDSGPVPRKSAAETVAAPGSTSPATRPSDVPPATGAAPLAPQAPATAPPSSVSPSPASSPTGHSAASGSTTNTAMAAEPPDGGMASTADADARIVLRAKSDSWVEVRDPQSNTLLAARLLKAGDVYRIPDRPGLKLVTGNAGGLVVMVDGEVAPSLGKEGAVRRGVPLDADTLRRGIDSGTQGAQ